MVQTTMEVYSLSSLCSSSMVATVNRVGMKRLHGMSCRRLIDQFSRLIMVWSLLVSTRYSRLSETEQKR